jgi:hypothetical protein
MLGSGGLRTLQTLPQTQRARFGFSATARQIANAGFGKEKAD